MTSELKKDLRDLAEPGRAINSQWFFKTGPGEYGEGDKFLGVTVPNTRLVAKKYKELPVKDLKQLLDSKWHEERLLALIIMVNQFKSSTGSDQEKQTKRQELYELYLDNTQRINNWDLVDTSARDIVGGYIYEHQELLAKLDELAVSDMLWERRIAIIASSYFLGKGEPDVTIKLSKVLLKDKEDLIHKAVGWMLREMGKRCDRQLLLDFIDQYAFEMPRTTLRYSIEHLDQSTRKKYLEMKKLA